MSKPKIPLPEGCELGRCERPFFAKAVGRAFEVKAAKDGLTEIDLYDEIGFFGITAKQFRERLRGAGDVRLRINSPGGDVFQGIAIYNDLVDHPGAVQVEIPGLAASAASIIAMAGDSIRIAESAFMMIHNAWGIVLGDRHDMAHVASVLTDIDKTLARIYANRSDVGIRAVSQMMDEETWMTGKDAVDQGFADALSSEGVDARASFDLSCFKHAPTSKEGAPNCADWHTEPFTIRDVERTLRDAGCTKHRARDLAAKAFASDDRRDADRADSSHRRDADERIEDAAEMLLAEMRAALNP